MAKKESLPRLIEYFLMDALREGLSQHLAGNTPCNFILLDKILVPLQFALGNFDLNLQTRTHYIGQFGYKDLNYNARFDPDLKFRRVYNDDKVDRPLYYREHMLYLQSTGVFLTSESIPSAELKKWDGERSICSAKGKKKMQFVGRESGKSGFISKLVIKAPWTFKGSECIPTDGWPQEQFNLWPLKTGERTIFG